MGQLSNDFNFNPAELPAVIAPIAEAHSVLQGVDGPIYTSVRAMVFTETLEEGTTPQISADADGNVTITYATVTPAASGAPANPYEVWTKSILVELDLTTVTVFAKNTNPGTTSRGTQVTVQHGSGTIDD